MGGTSIRSFTVTFFWLVQAVASVKKRKSGNSEKPGSIIKKVTTAGENKSLKSQNKRNKSIRVALWLECR
jgi:hypothetical protein